MTNHITIFRKQKIFNKKSGRWRVTEKKVAKSYGHIDILVKKVLDIRLTDVRGMSRRVQMEATDPRLISPTIAPVLPGTTEEISSKQKSRFLTDLWFLFLQKIKVAELHGGKGCDDNCESFLVSHVISRKLNMGFTFWARYCFSGCGSVNCG